MNTKGFVAKKTANVKEAKGQWKALPGSIIHQEHLREGQERKDRFMNKMNQKGKMRAKQA